MIVLKVKVISLPYISQVLYGLCFTRPRYQVSVYRTIGTLVLFVITQNKLIKDVAVLRAEMLKIIRNKKWYVPYSPFY